MVNTPNLGSTICLCVGSNMLLYAGKSRECLEPKELDRKKLRSRIELFAEANYVLMFYFESFLDKIRTLNIHAEELLEFI